MNLDRGYKAKDFSLIITSWHREVSLPVSVHEERFRGKKELYIND